MRFTKIVFIVIIFCFLSLFNLLAEDNIDAIPGSRDTAFYTISIGNKAGMNMNFRSEPYGNGSAGPAASIFCEVGIGKYFNTQLSITYNRGGFNSDLYRIRTDFLQIPLVVKMGYPLNRFEPYAYAGFNFIFTLSSSIEDLSTLIVYDFSDSYNVFIFGIPVGLGCDIPITPIAALFLEINFDINITRAITASEHPLITTEPALQMGCVIFAGYKLKIFG